MGGSSGSEETGTRGDENVIRLPREWIGPRDELVPIRPPSFDGAGGGPGAAGGPDPETPPAADAFWTENAG
ncbi:MAG TPA: hypothetical protein VFN87_17905, partial [Solirubrobacteraceae bacterium]|nr:hypothetical protein [Solirubrobacteraceae bacterium]